MCAAVALRGCPASTTAIRRRARHSTRAADRPAAPPPTTTTSYSFMTGTVARSRAPPPPAEVLAARVGSWMVMGSGGDDELAADGAGLEPAYRVGHLG